MSQNVPTGKQQFFDINGKPLVGGMVYNYVVSTNTLLTTYQDSALTIPNTNPVILDARGQCSMYATGNIRQVLQDATGVQIWDQVVLDAVANIPAKPNALLNIQIFTSNGTYTPTPGMKNAFIRFCGAGGGSGAVPATSPTQLGGSGGGAAGAYGEAWLTAAQIGVSQSITIGAGGAAGVVGGAGGQGGNSQMGSGPLLFATGGNGSVLGVLVTSTIVGSANGAFCQGACIGANVLNTAGGSGDNALIIANYIPPIFGGNNSLGVKVSVLNISYPQGYGSGGPGVRIGLSSAATVGAAGFNGVFIIEEYS